MRMRYLKSTPTRFTQSSTTPPSASPSFSGSYHADTVRLRWILAQFSPILPAGPGFFWRWMQHFSVLHQNSKFFCCQFTRRINRCSGFVYDHILHFSGISWKSLYDHLLRFSGCRSISNGKERDVVTCGSILLIFLLPPGSFFISRCCRVNDGRIQHFPVASTTASLHPVTERRSQPSNEPVRRSEAASEAVPDSCQTPDRTHLPPARSVHCGSHALLPGAISLR